MIDALVLAGGRASRMQTGLEGTGIVDKAQLLLGGEPLIAHVVRTRKNRYSLHQYQRRSSGLPQYGCSRR